MDVARLATLFGYFRNVAVSGIPPCQGGCPPQPVAAQVSSIPPVIACGGGGKVKRPPSSIEHAHGTSYQ